MAVEEVCQLFNDLRSDLVLMYDLRTILLNYVFELQTLKHQCESLMPDKVSFFHALPQFFILILKYHDKVYWYRYFKVYDVFLIRLVLISDPLIFQYLYQQILEIPESLMINTGEESPSRPRAISEMIDAVATPTTPNVSFPFYITLHVALL